MDYTVDYVRIAVLTPYDKVLTFLDNKVANAMHYYDDVLHTYLKGSTYTYEFKTLTDYEDAVYLVEGNKLSFKYKDKGYYMTIMNVEKGGEETTVTAYGLCLELTNEMVDAYKASRAMSFVEYVNAYGFDDSFTIGKNEVSDKRITHEWTGQDTILARLYSIANVFDAELEFVTELNDDYSLKRVVLNVYRAHSDSVQGLGKDRTGTILRYPSDIHSITKTSDITELYTGIRPTGTDGLQLNSISGRTVKDSNGNTLYYVSGNNLLAPQSRDRFPSSLLTSHNNDMYAVEIWSYDTNNVETLYGQALAELKKHVNPKVEYDIDAYIDAGIGDTFTIEDAEYNPVLYLEARITEQEISFTDKTKCKTVFDNFEEIQSQISSALLSEMNKLIEAKKLYDCSIISDKGLFLKNDSDITVLQAQVKDNGKDVTSDFIFKWYKNNSEYTTNDSINVKGSEVADATVYRYEAIKNNVVRGTCEVTVCRVLDGQDGVNAYLHIAYANSGDGLLDFSLTDSNRKFIGQYTDSNQYSSEDASMYRWSAIKGEDGQSLVDYVQQFYYSDSNEEPTGGEWFETSPEWQKGKFLWKRYKATYENPDEIKYTKAIYDPTWNQLDQKIGEIQWDVDVAKNTSAEAVTKATEASDLSQEAKDLATSANSKSDDAVSKAEEANTSTANANKEIDKINTSISDAKKDIQSALDQANANSDEIGTIKETYSTKVETDKVKADLSTEITTKVGELSTSVSENYATKNDVVEIEGNLNTKITQNADSISSTASKVEKLESDTTQAQKDINDAMAKANQAQTDASTAQDLANKAQSTADSASTALNEANEKLETAQTKLTTAEDNLAKIKTQVDATEKEVADAQEKVANAQAQVEQAQKDVEQAQSTASTAVANAKAAQTTADDAKTKAEKAQSDLAALTNRVTSAETSIKQNSEQITINANKTTEVSNAINSINNNIQNNYYNKTQTDAQIKASADSINLTVSEVSKTVTSANTNATNALNKANTASTNASSALTKANDLTTRANNGEFDGRGVASTKVEYQASASGTTVPTSTWSTTIPTVANGSYLWTRTTITYTDKTTSISYSVARMGTNGAKGDKGDTGKGIKSTSVTYQAWKDGTTTPTGTWSSTPPQTTASNPFLWTKTVITYTDNTNSTSYSIGSTIDGVQIGGRNLLSHSSMIGEELECDSINTCNDVTKREYTTDGYHIVTPSSGNANNGIGFIIDDFTTLGIAIGDTITFSLYVKGTSDTNAPFINVIFQNEGTTWYGSGIKSSSRGKFNPTDTFQKVSVTYTVPTDGKFTSKRMFLCIHGNYQSNLYIKNLKLEVGNKSTDWTPAPEDIEQNTYDSINAAIDASEKSTEQKYVSLINETSKKLELLVQQLETTTTKNSTSITDISNRLQITSEMAQFVKTTTEQLEDMVNGKMSSSEIKQWARFDGANLELGASDQPFKCKLSTTELAFYQNENKVAWISNNELHVLRAIIAESIGCGNFKFIDEGDLGFSLI